MTRSKKIIFIASFSESLLRFRLQLMQAWQALGYEVVAIAPEDANVEKKLKQLNIKLISVPIQRNGLNPIRDIFLVMRLVSILKQEQPDIVLSYTIKPIIYGSLSAWLAKVPNIYSLVTGTGYVFLNANLKGKIIGFIATGLFRLAFSLNQGVLFQNKDNLAFFRDKKILSSRKSAFVVNGSGVDCHEFSLTVHPKQISFLLIARLLYDKGVLEYVEAAKLVRSKFPQVTFKLAGWIDTNPNAISQQQLTAWIQEGDIAYLGRISDVQSAIADCAVYVLPSYHEGMPRTVLEAMAMGRPIITTDTSGCRDTVDPGKNGFLVPVKDVKILAEMMEYFIENPEKVSEMGRVSRQMALDKYDVHKVNQSMISVMAPFI